MRNLKIHTPSEGGGDYRLFSIRGRSYDIDIQDCLLVGGGNGYTIYVDVDYPGAGVCNGRVKNCEFQNTTGADPFNLSAPDPDFADWIYDGDSQIIPTESAITPYITTADRGQ